MNPSQPARRSRGRRIASALTLATIAAAAGAYGGWHATTPTYTSTGMMRIKTNMRYYVYPPAAENPVQLISLTRSQAQLLQDPRVLDYAMASDEWRALRRDAGPEARDAFRDSLRVETRPDEPEWIYIRFTDPNPRAAKIAVGQTINSYVKIHGVSEMIITPSLIAELTNKIKTKQAEIVNVQTQINEVGRAFGTNDMESLHQEGLKRQVALDSECAQLESDIKQSEESGKVLRNADGLPRLVPVTPDNIAAMKVALKLKGAERDESLMANLRMNQARTQIAALGSRLKKLQAQCDDIERRHTMLVTENGTESANRIQIISEGDEPSRPSTDYRIPLAALGFVVAGGMTFAAGMLWSAKGSLPQT